MFTKGQKAYVASSDTRQNGFECTVTSIGKKYITVTDEYGRKWRFGNNEHYVCEEWAIYSLHASEVECKKEKEMEEKLHYIINNSYRLQKVLTEEEINDLYDKLKSI